MSRTDLERDLERLRVVYRRKLPARVAELEALLSGAPALPASAQLEAARSLAHMLKGTTGTYGFMEISGELARIEESLDRELQKASPQLGAARREVERFIESVRAWLADSGEGSA